MESIQSCFIRFVRVGYVRAIADYLVPMPTFRFKISRHFALLHEKLLGFLGDIQ